MTTLTYPLSRIEGHARVVIDIYDDEVFRADFQAMEMRGFSYYVQGIPAEQITVIVPRICGVCSTAHQVASVKALEDIFDVTPPPLAEDIREVLLLGQLIQNQATSLFIFTMPDRVNASSLFEMEEEDQKQRQFSMAQMALKIRKIGTDLISLAGGQFIHPIKTVIGGVTSGIPRQKADEMIKTIDTLLPTAVEMVDNYWELSMKMGDRIGSWGDDEPSYYLASTEENSLRLNSNRIRVLCPDGPECYNFAPYEYQDYLKVEMGDYSYAGVSSFKGKHVMRANSLARINLAHSLDMPIADAYLKRFVEDFGRPAHAIMFFDLCRGIELVYALEKARKMLEADLEHGQTEVPYSPRDGEGFGLVEAPRGPLIHHYEVENGLIKRADFVIPTVHNMLAIRRALTVVAKRYVSPEGIDSELEKAVGRVVRAFDPCIACATN